MIVQFFYLIVIAPFIFRTIIATTPIVQKTPGVSSIKLYGYLFWLDPKRALDRDETKSSEAEKRPKSQTVLLRVPR